MIDVRLRSRISAEELDSKKGKVLTDADYSVLFTRDALVRKPDGTPLALYRPGIIPEALADASYPILQELRRDTANRGLAGGTRRWKGAGRRTEAKRVQSQVVGALDAQGVRQFCRLTAWTGREPGKWQALWPLLEFIGERMKVDAPDRHRAQLDFVEQTQPEWVIPGTPFTTVTVNNSYSTGVHTDKGDLDEGISTLAVLRRGDFSGGVFVMPEYRVGFDMGDRDLLLLDAHEWHGNTWLVCNVCGKAMERRHDACGTERISVVAYFRTRMVECLSGEEERDRQLQYAEARNTVKVGD